MTVFVDTSALYALSDRDDVDHPAAAHAFPELARAETLLTHNYVVIEAAAVVHRRLGWPAARDLLERLVPVIEIHWVDREIHDAGAVAHLAAIRRNVSLVDWVSFEVMRRLGVERAFAFDRDFTRQGFELVP